MAQLWSDSFDMYATPADAMLNYSLTTGVVTNMSIISATSTAFGVGQALFPTATSGTPAFSATFETGTNEQTVFFSIRAKSANTTSTATWTMDLTLLDGTNSQVTIRWRGDGAILVYSGSTTGTLLATYTSQFSLNTWDSWQGKIVINNATGSVELRKNGSATPITTPLTNVNTMAGSSNAYANRFQLAFSNSYWEIDDLWLSSASGAAPTSWPGDVRAVTLNPSAAVGTPGFTAAGTAASTSETFGQTSGSGANNALGRGANSIYFIGPYSPTRAGTVTGGQFSCYFSATGHFAVAVYDASGPSGGPGTLLAQSVPVTNEVDGVNSFTLTSSLSVSPANKYWLAINSDASYNLRGPASVTVATAVLSQNYSAGFPSTTTVAVSTTTGQQGYLVLNNNWLAAGLNAAAIGDATEDGDASYVYSSTIGAEDLYSLTSLPSAPTVIHGVRLFSYWRKSDSGARVIGLQCVANNSADTTELSVTPSLSYTWGRVFLATDPTGAAWLPATVNGIQAGIKIIS